MGFLSKLLPMAAGAASTYFTGNPYLGMALAGGVTAQKTGSLQQGMLAGLSAYGGGQLASGLQAAGNSAISNAAAAANPSFVGPMPGAASGLEAAQAGVSALSEPAGRSAFMSGVGGAKGATMAGLAAASPMLLQQPEQPQMQPGDSTMPQRLKYEQGTATPFPQPDVPGYGDLGQDFGRQNNFFPGAGYVNMTPEEAKARRGYAGGGPIEQMSNANAIGMNTGYPQSDITGHAYATPWQTPTSQNVVHGTADTGVNRMTGQMLAGGGMARGGLSDLGSYSDGGRLLKGPGDGVSDSIPAVIGQKQPARLADGEFVVPARIVSELGNGSTEAGARKLYAMMDRVQKARGKTVGKGKVAKNSRADRYLPA
jgi:hypothetical protein